MPNIEECCGFGGTFSVKMPGTSLAMGQHEGGEHRPQRGRGGGVGRHQLPDAHRRHPAPRPGDAPHPHHAHRRGAGGGMGAMIRHCQDSRIKAKRRNATCVRIPSPSMSFHVPTMSHFGVVPRKRPRALRAERAGSRWAESPQRSSQAQPRGDRRDSLFPRLASGGPQIKQYAIANLDKLLVQFERQITAKGAKVLFAEDAAEANRRPRHRPETQRQEAWSSRSRWSARSWS